MAADLREMQENQGFSENRIDKIEFTRQKARGRRYCSGLIFSEAHFRISAR